MPDTTSPTGTPAIDIDAFLDAQDAKDQLRFLTCGSVDDGKSTLLGRLLYDSKTIFEDQLSAAETESRKFGTQGDQVDLALLVDGLQAEREQGITIDVAYRFFETDKRKFIAADTPGHEQYTRNMATGASTAELAIILIDARKGVLTQTKRHSYIVGQFGIRHVILAVNKMDLVGYDRAVFDAIVSDYKDFAGKIGLTDIRAIPLSALTGENVFTPQTEMPWYDGPPLMEILETIDVRGDLAAEPFRFPVQWVNRPNLDFRGFSGLIPSGTVAVGDPVAVYPAETASRVTRIVGPSGDLDRAVAGQSVTLVLADEIDVSRGDLIAPAPAAPADAGDNGNGNGEAPLSADQFAAHILWMDQEEMLPERSYIIRFATASAQARVTDLTHRLDVNTLDKLAAKTLGLNEIGYCKMAIDRAVAFDPFGRSRATGAFVLIDRFTNATVGAGVVDFALRRASNIAWHDMKVDRALRSRALGQTPRMLWFTGLSGAGKSTIADRLEQRLQAAGKHTYLLDGDNVRHGLNKDLGFTDRDRVENIRRVAEVGRLMVDAGLITLVSFISPFRSEREMARALMDEGEFVEIHVDTPLEICERRDPKGLYKKARSGKLKNFTGIDSDYEPPENPELVLKAGEKSVDQLVDQILEYLNR
ncbi:MAG: sulfate adenylyltransferase subunit CysN [Alphaproteobacteria bacterium]|nr:sulfate adenylyltransferase subunit CysN [Alphaproteobacteria bacterium]